MKRITVPSTQGMPLVQVMLIEELNKKVDQVLEILKRIEERQIKTTAAVMEVTEHEAPVVGSFATTDK